MGPKTSQQHNSMMHHPTGHRTGQTLSRVLAQSPGTCARSSTTGTDRHDYNDACFKLHSTAGRDTCNTLLTLNLTFGTGSSAFFRSAGSRTCAN